jgi:hypothetical protein
MMLVDEKSLGTVPTSEVETLAIRRLKQMGVRTVDQDMVRTSTAKTQQMLKQAGDPRGAAAIGMEFGADVIVVGEAVAKPSPRRIAESNLRAYQAAVSLRAVRTDNAANLTGASENATVPAFDDVVGSAEALKAAAAKTLDVLLPEMVEAWKESGAAIGKAELRPVLLNIGGVDQVWKLRNIRDRLRGFGEKAVNVSQRSYTAGVAVFELESAMPAEELAEELVLTPPENLKLQVLETGPGRISLKATAAQP